MDYSYENEPRPESSWERKLRLEAEQKAKAVADMLATRCAVLQVLQAQAIGEGLSTYNLLAFENRTAVSSMSSKAVPHVKTDSLLHTALCWLREKGAIGIVGFSGSNSKALGRFLARAKRLDIRLFSGIAEVTV